MTATTPNVDGLADRDLTDVIGRTPLIRLRRVVADVPDVEIYGKAEWFNPGGSVKDRAALAMILDGERSGRLTHDKIILDATSGNTGIAYAMIGAARGYRVRLCLPANANAERKRILAIYGAEIVFVERSSGNGPERRVVKHVEPAPSTEPKAPEGAA